jgi:hypothetical protein
MRVRPLLPVARCLALSFVLLALGCASALAAPVTFTRTDVTVSHDCTDVKLGDLDGDGDLDVIAVSPYDHVLAVLLNIGGGVFGPPTFYSVGGAFEFTIGDLNGDGFLDVATANIFAMPGVYDTTVSVLLGLGDGSFLPHVEFATLSSPSGIAIADVNGDGLPDIVTANYEECSNALLPGNGDGTFDAPIECFSTCIPNTVAIADLDRDGFLDAVNAVNGFNHIAVSRGAADGALHFSGAFPTGNPSPHGVSLADFNGDGRADVASGNRGGTVAFVLSGTGDGGFQTALQLPFPTAPISITVGDVDGDGLADIAAALPGWGLGVALGNGDGTFGPPTRYIVQLIGLPGIALGDVDGDGRMDAVTANGTDGMLSIFRNTSGAPTHVVQVKDGAHGLVAPLGAPLGSVTVPDGGSRTFTFTSYVNYELADVKVDGTSIGAPGFYTFSGVTSDHTLEVSFVSSVSPPPLVGLLEIRPHNLNIESKANWITAYITPPAPFAAGQIDNNSLRLNGVSFAPEFTIRTDPANTHLVVRFDRVAVVATLTPGDNVPLTMTGTVGDEATPFVAVDYVDARGAVMHVPVAGDRFAPGAVVDVSWDLPSSAPHDAVTLLSTFDEGATWNLEADGLANTGSYSWQAPNADHATVRLAVTTVDLWDETGPVNWLEFAESGAFSISSSTAVGPDGASVFALRGVAPQPATTRFAVWFSLPDAASARLDVFDTSGRRVLEREVGSLGAGAHRVEFDRDGRFAPGVYLVRLSRAGRSESARLVML